ncbi:MAG TPA: RcpC/CpaB family pilus assembly protein [Phycisphaeraceae bacterium]
MSQFSLPPSVPPGNTKLVAVAAIVAAVAVVLVNVYIEVVRRQAREGEFIVYRLTTSVRPGDRLSERDAQPVAVPERFRDSFGDALDETGFRARLGEPFRRSANRNDVLTYALFTDPQENDLDRRIGLEMREKALPVNPRSLPAGLRPGAYVDIEAHFPDGAGSRVLPVMERVKVLAVGPYSVADESSDASGRPMRAGSFASISVEVTPEQATQLAAIQTIIAGDFEIHLRNPGDTGTPKIPSGGINPQVLALVESRSAGGTVRSR